MKNLYPLIFLLTLLINTAIAQDNIEFIPSNFDSQEEYDEAIKFLYQGHDYYDDGIEWYDLALENYLKASEYNSENADLNYRMGFAIFMLMIILNL